MGWSLVDWQAASPNLNLRVSLDFKLFKPDNRFKFEIYAWLSSIACLLPPSRCDGRIRSFSPLPPRRRRRTTFGESDGHRSSYRRKLVLPKACRDSGCSSRGFNLYVYHAWQGFAYYYKLQIIWHPMHHLKWSMKVFFRPESL